MRISDWSSDVCSSDLQLSEVVATLEQHPYGSIYEGFAESANAGAPFGFFDHSPMLGRANPLAPPIELELLDDCLLGPAPFPAAYQGPPGCVHGGIVAASFDEATGYAHSLPAAPATTGR